MKTNEIILMAKTLDINYCKKIILEYKKKKIDLSLFYLYNDIISLKKQKDIIKAYIDYFNFIYINLNYYIEKEEFEKASLLRDANNIDKKIAEEYSDNLDDETLNLIKTTEEEFKRLYNI